VGQQVEEGTFVPPKKVEHTHVGSLGNLALDKIQEKFDRHF
jgi:argininosuccinate lyase